MGKNEERSPCVTPNAELYNFEEGRPFTGCDKLVFQAFPMMDLKVKKMTERAPQQQKKSMLMLLCHCIMSRSINRRLRLTVCHVLPNLFILDNLRTCTISVATYLVVLAYDVKLIVHVVNFPGFVTPSFGPRLCIANVFQLHSWLQWALRTLERLSGKVLQSKIPDNFDLTCAESTEV